MSNPESFAAQSIPEELNQTSESFGSLFREYERTHARQPEDSGKQIEGTVIAVSPEQTFVDIGMKVEGVLPNTEGDLLHPGDRVLFSMRGRNEEGYYALTRFKVADQGLGFS